MRVYACAILLASMGSPAAAGRFDGRLAVEDFEAFVWGEDWATVQFSPGADPRMKAERETVHSGRQACRLDLPPGETLTLVPQQGTRFVGKGEKPPLPLPGTPGRVGLWVHGQRSGHRIWLRLLDAAGKTHELALGAVDFEGWRLIEARTLGLPAPLALAAIVLRGGEGSLVIDDLTVATSSNAPLHLSLQPPTDRGDFVEGRPIEFRVSVQSLAEEPIEGVGELAAFEAASPGVRAANARFRFRASAAEPFAKSLRLRLPPGVHRLEACATIDPSTSGGTGVTPVSRQVVVHPEAPRAPERALRAIRAFGQGDEALRVVESAFSPALVAEAAGDRLTLFRGLAEEGLRPPEQLLARVAPRSMELLEPWILLWFGAAPEWKGVRMWAGPPRPAWGGDRLPMEEKTRGRDAPPTPESAPCPTFDVPFLVVLDQAPVSWTTEGGLELRFRRRGVRAAVGPVFGIRRLDPAETTAWHGTVETIGAVSKMCRWWTPLLSAVPVDVTEQFRVDAERDAVEVRVRFDFLESRGGLGVAPRRAAPVPPLLMLARQGGLPVRFSKEPVPTGCWTSVGPYWVVPDADGYTYTVSGLLRFVLSAVADVPPGVPGAQVSLARDYRSLSDDAAKIPFWVAHGGAAGRHASEALARLMLAPDNARYAYDAGSRRLRAWDGLLAHNEGDEAAAPFAAELLQGCWYAGLHAGAWDALRPRWRQAKAFRETLVGQDDWATLGVGSGQGWADLRLDAALYSARLATRLGDADDYTQGCAQAVKLMVAAYALAAMAPKYVAELGPWPGLAEQQGRAIGRCAPGSVGFAPGPPPFMTTPSDGGYAFAAEFLGEYYRERFHGGPLDYFGRSPAEWSERLFVSLGGPDAGKRFRPAAPPAGPFATNYVCSVEPGRDGWPALVWHSHRAPAGGPLGFGSIGTAPDAKGRLLRREAVRPWLRLSAYAASEAPQPPREPTPPPPPKPKLPPAEVGPGIPDRSLP